MLTDDLPWPELGNVSRGTTRGNQGQKGTLGPPDAAGRRMLQLRVQPGVLEVRLGRTASAWYTALDAEVAAALRLTKNYWRKARRRQDYDARADQDHMELHEWLQQLKDKAMAHVELLVQKGDVPGPPYVLPDAADFPFMRGFVERQARGVPHNPRLRNAPHGAGVPPGDLNEPGPAEQSEGMEEQGSAEESVPAGGGHSGAGASQPPRSRTWAQSPLPEQSTSSLPLDIPDLVQKAESSQSALEQARKRLSSAKNNSQDALAKYMACLEIERTAQAETTAAEEKRDDIVVQILEASASHRRRAPRPAHAPPSAPHAYAPRHHPARADPAGPARHACAAPWGAEVRARPPDAHGARDDARRPLSARSWPESEGTASGQKDDAERPAAARKRPDTDGAPASPPRGAAPHEITTRSARTALRKHTRDWDQPPLGGQDHVPEAEDRSPTPRPPRKRAHQAAPAPSAAWPDMAVDPALSSPGT